MIGQRIGYIRVSTLDQHTERQLDGIEVDKTFTRQSLRQRYETAAAGIVDEFCAKRRYRHRP